MVFRGALNLVLAAIFPPRCAVCDAITDDLPICASCKGGVNWLSTDFFSAFLKKTSFAVARSVAAYDGAWAEMIHNFKYNKRTDLAKPLAGMLAERIDYEYDLVVPVPLHPKRVRERGYNQSALLARHVARKAGFKCGYNTLHRVKYAAHQVGLSQADRVQNVKEAFFCKKELKGEDILLIDDVMTTGATVNECARALKKAGAGRVDVLTLARTAL